MNAKRMAAVLSLSLTVALAGCGGDDAEPAAPAAAEPTAAAAPDVPATGKVIEVQMVTDEKGNYYEPADLTVQRGDVVRFVLASGVHNVSFPAEMNPGAAGLPEVGPMLQLPGQTHDVMVTMEPGEYGYQCDPHAALGMVGTLKVQE